MRIVLDGRKAVGRARGYYFENSAYFTKRGQNKRYVLHEFYHHLVEAKGWEMPNSVEEENARSYAREFLGTRYC